MEGLLQDLGHAARSLRRSPALTVAAVVTLGVALGANTALFSLVNAILLRPLPGIGEPDRLVNVHRTADDGTTFLGFSRQDAAELAERGRDWVRLAAFNGRGASLGTDGAPELVGTQLVSGSYFAVLDVRPALGRLLTEADDRAAGASPVMVLSHSLWQRRFGSDPAVLGRTVRLNGSPFTVVGVAPRGFQGHFVGFPFEVWVPLAMSAWAAPGEDVADRSNAWLELVGRLPPGVSRSQAQAGLTTVMAGMAREHPQSLRGAGVDVRAMTGVDDSLRPGVVGFLAALQAVGLLIVLVACVNVAGLLLVRAVGRTREVAVRIALGAPRSALIRQVLTETLALFVLGGATGVALAFSTADLLHAFQPASPVPLRFDLALDPRVLSFAAGAALLTGVACGLVPALHAGGVGSLAGLGDGRVAGGPRLRLRALLVCGQVALTTLVLVQAGLFLRTLQTAQAVHPGFDADGVHTARLDLTLLGRDEAFAGAFYRQLVERLAAEPAVRSASLAQSIPLRSLAPPMVVVAAQGPVGPSGAGLGSVLNAVTPGYFETMRIPVRSGRGFFDTDGPRARSVAIVSEELARRLWPGRDAVGRRIWQGSRECEVVGVAGDVKIRRVGEDPQPQMYVPLAQSPQPRARLLVRGEGDLSRVVSRQVQALAPDLPVMESMPLREAIAFALFPQRMAGSIAGALGILGLMLTATGLYGVMAHSVSLRTREMGVRLALGARGRDLASIVVGQGLRVALAGMAVGALVAVGLARVVQGLLPGVSPTDAPTFVSVALLMTAVATAASYVPARRASRVDPAVALRSE